MQVYPTDDALDIAEPFRLLHEAKVRWDDADQRDYLAGLAGDIEARERARLDRDTAENMIVTVEHHLATICLISLRLIPKYYPTLPAARLLQLLARVDDLEEVFNQEICHDETR